MKKSGLLICLLLAFSFHLSAQLKASTRIRRIDAYAKQIEAYAARRPRSKLVFADVSESERPVWRRFASEAAFEKFRETNEPYTTALVWRRNGQIVNANFTLSSESGDWAQYDQLYFRPDGSVAKIDSELRTFYGNLIVLRAYYFDPRGRMLRRTVRYRDLNTNKPVAKPAESYLENKTAFYKKTAALPFAKMIK
jgi:hypothetical protein